MTSGKMPPDEAIRPTSVLPICDPHGIAPLVAVLEDEQVLEIANLCLIDALEKTNLAAHAADIENWADVAMFAHDIKSSAGQLGATRLQDLAVRLEHNCKNDGSSHGPELVAAVKETAQLTKTIFDTDKILEIMALARASQ